MAIHTMHMERKHSLDSIFIRLVESMPSSLKTKFTIEARTSTVYVCTINPAHNSQRKYVHSVFPISTDDVLPNHVLQDGLNFDILKVIEHKMSLHNYSSFHKCSSLSSIPHDKKDSPNSDCIVIQNPDTCGADTIKSTTVTNSPEIFLVSYTNTQNNNYSPNVRKDIPGAYTINLCKQ